MIHWYSTTQSCRYHIQSKFLAVSNALKFGLTFLARISEYIFLPNADVHHHIKSKDVRFAVKSQREDDTQSIKWVKASDIHLFRFSSIEKVIVDLTNSKNDQDGKGQRVCYKPNDPNFDKCLLWCPVRILFDLCASLRPSDDNPLFSWADGNYLSREDIDDAINVIANHYNLDLSRVTPHSLRIGGATAMAAAGIPIWIIRLIGRWKSEESVLQYIRLNESIFKQGISAIVNPTVFDANEITDWNAAFQLIINVDT